MPKSDTFQLQFIGSTIPRLPVKEETFLVMFCSTEQAMMTDWLYWMRLSIDAFPQFVMILIIIGVTVLLGSTQIIISFVLFSL